LDVWNTLNFHQLKKLENLNQEDEEEQELATLCTLIWERMAVWEVKLSENKLFVAAVFVHPGYRHLLFKGNEDDEEYRERITK
jgi:hypothetical protein